MLASLPMQWSSQLEGHTIISQLLEYLTVLLEYIDSCIYGHWRELAEHGPYLYSP